MDRNSSADNLPPVLSVENLIRGIMTLGERLAKIILAGLQKGLENLARAELLPHSIVREFRQLKVKILEGRNEETTVNAENMLLDIVTIGQMLFRNGWTVELLVNHGGYPAIGIKKKTLAAVGRKQVGNDTFHLSIIAGEAWGFPRGPADEYEEVDLKIWVTGNNRTISSVGRVELENILRDPTIFCPTSAEYFRERRARKKRRKKIAP